MKVFFFSVFVFSFCVCVLVFVLLGVKRRVLIVDSVGGGVSGGVCCMAGCVFFWSKGARLVFDSVKLKTVSRVCSVCGNVDVS